MGVRKICNQCKKSFEANLSESKRRGRCKFCSLPCYWASLRKGNLAKDGIKKCSKCLTERSVDDFNNDTTTKDKLARQCADCINGGKFGFSSVEYRQMLENQDGGCAICRTKPNGKRLSIDHCHVNGHVRGLLCQNCNQALGFFKDDVQLMQEGINYIKESHVRKT